MSSDDKRQTDDGIPLSRRRYVQALAAAGVGGIAGCGGDGDGTTTDAPTDTPTDTSGGEPGDDPTSTPTETQTGDEPTETPQGPPQSESISIPIVNVPQQTNFNQHAPAPQNVGMDWFEEMPNATAADSQEWFLNATFDAPWIQGVDEITVPTIQTNVEINAPYEWTDTLHEELTYWDGTPLNADARLDFLYVNFGMDGYLFDDTATFNREKTGEFEILNWRDRGDVEGQEADPANRRTIRSDNALWGNCPTHPGFLEQYVDRFENASSQSEADSITSDIESNRISIFDWADNEWGSSLYQIESSDDISSQSATATLRDDHPASEFATVPELEVLFTSAENETIVQNEGEVDVDEGLVKPEGARWVRSSLQDYTQQVDQWLQSGGNDQMVFNWHNPHLQRLWVRRAIIAAVDWVQVGANGWGSWKSVPDDVHAFMAPASAEAFFPSDFIDSLHTWPMRSDFQVAEEYMNNAGYTKTGGDWVGPDGNRVELRYIWPSNFADWVGRVQTVAQNLRDFGFSINVEGTNQNAWQNAILPSNLNYDINTMWGPGGPVLTCYDAYAANWGDPIAGGPEGGSNNEWASRDDTVDHQNMPFEVQLPSEVGNIDAPAEAGRTPDLSGAGIDAMDFDVIGAILDLREPDTSEEDFMSIAQNIAWFYNYYLPDFSFHQYATGLMGNVRDFNFAPQGHPANAIAPVFGADGYQIGAGLPQLKYDDEYPDPQTF